MEIEITNNYVVLDENGYDTRYSKGFSEKERNSNNIQYKQLQKQMVYKVMEANTEYSSNIAPENSNNPTATNSQVSMPITSVAGGDSTETINPISHSNTTDHYAEIKNAFDSKISKLKVGMVSDKILKELNISSSNVDTIDTVDKKDNVDTSLAKNVEENTVDDSICDITSDSLCEKPDEDDNAQVSENITVRDVVDDIDKTEDLPTKIKMSVTNELVEAISKNLVNNTGSEIDAIERILSKGGLDVNQRFQILSHLSADKQLTTTDRVVLVSEINKSSSLTRMDKIEILEGLLKNNVIKTEKAKRYARNKIALLIKAINSNLVMTYNYASEKAQRKHNVLVTKQAENKTANKNIQENIHLEQLQKELKEKRSVLESVADILFDYSVTAEEKLQAINNVVFDVIKPERNLTQVMVSSRDYFKFGAGITCNDESLKLTLPSGYKLDSKFSKDFLLAYSTEVTDLENTEYLYQSPLVLNVEKKPLLKGDDLLNFFNSNIEECNENNLTYRQSVVGKCPAVIKYKKNSNEYKISVYNKNQMYTYMFTFQFNIPTVNMQSVVNRILSSVVFKEGE